MLVVAVETGILRCHYMHIEDHRLNHFILNPNWNTAQSVVKQPRTMLLIVSQDETHMNVRNILFQPDRKWHAKMPSSETEITQLASQADAPLPTEYVELLQLSNGGEGPLALAPLYFQLYSVKDCIELFHNNQQLREEFPGFMFFGSNGGVELIAFDVRSGPPWPIVMIDPIAGRESAEEIAPNVTTFIEAIGLESKQ